MAIEITRAKLRAIAIDRYNDVGDALAGPAPIGEATWNDALDETQQLISERCLCLGRVASYNVVAGTNAITVTSDVIKPEVVFYDGAKLTFRRGPAEIAHYHGDWTHDSYRGTPSECFFFGKTLYLVPTPDTSVANGLTAWEFYLAPNFDSDDDVPSIPAYGHRALIYGACAIVAAQESDADPNGTRREYFEDRLNYYLARISSNIKEPTTEPATINFQP